MQTHNSSITLTALALGTNLGTHPCTNIMCEIYNHPVEHWMDDMSPRIFVRRRLPHLTSAVQHPAACLRLRKPKRKKKRISSKILAAAKHHATEPSTTAREPPSLADFPNKSPEETPPNSSILRSHFLRAVRLRRPVYHPSPPSPLLLPTSPRTAAAEPLALPPMAASLLHAAASSPLAGPNPAARAAFRPLASSPFLRLARSSPDRRGRLDASLRALSGGARLAAGVAAPRSRRFVAALAGEEPVSTRPLRDPCPGFLFPVVMPRFDFRGLFLMSLPT